MVDGLAGALVRPAPAARQLAHRRAAGGVLARARSATRRWLKDVAARRPARRRSPRTSTRAASRRDRRSDPPLPAARRGLGRGGRRQGGEGARARGARSAQGVAHERSRPSRRRSRSTRSSTSRTASRRCGSSRCRRLRDRRAGGPPRRSRSGGARARPARRRRARHARGDRGSRSPTPTAPTSGCAGSWTPGARCGSGRSPTASPTVPTAADPRRSGSTALQALLGAHTRRRSGGRARPDHARRCRRAGTSSATPRRSTSRFAERRVRRRRCCGDHPWLAVCERIAEQQGFFHWELDFATVFARGGFDLQVGNPPWVRPRSDVDALLAEGDPWWQLAVKPTQSAGQREARGDARAAGHRRARRRRHRRRRVHGGVRRVGRALSRTSRGCSRTSTGASWSRRGATQSSAESSALIHPETHFTDEKAGALRAATYRRLRRHWQFVNELKLFEIEHQKSLTACTSTARRATVSRSCMATSLYHPDTVERSLAHDGIGRGAGPQGRGRQAGICARTEAESLTVDR